MDLDDSLQELTPMQRKWVVQRLASKSDATAAKAVGVSPNTVCNWKKNVDLDGIVEALLSDPLAQAMETILSAVPDAARAKVEGLKSRKEGIKQSSATEILNRTIGSPAQRLEHTGKEGGPIELRNDDERLARLIELLDTARARRDDAPSDG